MSRIWVESEVDLFLNVVEQKSAAGLGGLALSDLAPGGLLCSKVLWTQRVKTGAAQWRLTALKSMW
jgi:hypothetical protein